MDEYSVKTVRLLMQRHKDYLVSILRRHSDNVPSISELTEADAIRVLSSVNDCSMIPHANNKTVSSFYACKCGSKHITVREVAESVFR